MDKQIIGTTESIESKYRVNHVDSGLPRWLIELAFVCLLLQGICTWTPLMHMMEDHLPMVQPWGQAPGACLLCHAQQETKVPQGRCHQSMWSAQHL